MRHCISNASNCCLSYKTKCLYFMNCSEMFYETAPLSIEAESISLYTSLVILADLKDFNLCGCCK